MGSFLPRQLLRGLLVLLRRAADSLFARSLAFGNLSIALPLIEQRDELLFKMAQVLCSLRVLLAMHNHTSRVRESFQPGGIPNFPESAKA